MNTPNKLTVIRVILIPVFMALYLIEGMGTLTLAFLVFLAAAITDHYDGKLARENNQVTTFGKLMDPIADKLLIFGALLCFMQRGTGHINSWIIMVILLREFLVTGVRMLAMGENNVIAASIWGKAKTVSQFVLVIAVMVFEFITMCFEFMPFSTEIIAYIMDILTYIMVAVSVILTIFSGFDYVWKNKSIITFK